MQNILKGDKYIEEQERWKNGPGIIKGSKEWEDTTFLPQKSPPLQKLGTRGCLHLEFKLLHAVYKFGAIKDAN